MQHAVCVQVLHAPGSPAAHGRHLGPCQLQHGRVQHPIQRAPASARSQYSLYLERAYKDVIATLTASWTYVSSSVGKCSIPYSKPLQALGNPVYKCN